MSAEQGVGGQGVDGAADGVVDETIVVALPAVQDATIVVARPAPAAVDDSTMVVTSPRRARRATETGQPEPSRTSAVDDATIVVAAPLESARPAPRQPAPQQPTARQPISQPDPEATMAAVRTSSRDPAPPIEEPDAEISARELAKLLFKPPLDPRRRVKESPFPQLEHTLPKRGVSQSMPVVYGARSEELEAQPIGLLDLERRIGAPPTTIASPPVLREGLPSAAQLNRKFRLLALAGGAGVCVVVALGLWGIAALAFG